MRCSTISECMYLTATPCFERYSATSSAILFVSVVTSVRSPFFVRSLMSFTSASIWPVLGRTCTCGSTSPVGRTSCSTICPECSFSYSPGVADTNIAELIYFQTLQTSRVCYHMRLEAGIHSLQDASYVNDPPLYIARICGNVRRSVSDIAVFMESVILSA